MPLKSPRNLQDILKVKGSYFTVSEIEENNVGIHMYIPEAEKDPAKPLWERVNMPIDTFKNEIPLPYQNEAVWLAWIEYQFKNGDEPIGNFEPASALE